MERSLKSSQPVPPQPLRAAWARPSGGRIPPTPPPQPPPCLFPSSYPPSPDREPLPSLPTPSTSPGRAPGAPPSLPAPYPAARSCRLWPPSSRLPPPPPPQPTWALLIGRARHAGTCSFLRSPALHCGLVAQCMLGVVVLSLPPPVAMATGRGRKWRARRGG